MPHTVVAAAARHVLARLHHDLAISAINGSSVSGYENIRRGRRSQRLVNNDPPKLTFPAKRP
jgi:hypothetical protein